MDLTDSRTFELFLEIYGTLPRAGPGSAEITLEALAQVRHNDPMTVLDLGCGPGAQTLVLAEALPKASISALDLTPSMAAEAHRRVAQAGYGDRVTVEVGDMMAPGASPASVDLIWCEGAIYFAGVTTALQTWKPLLTPKGAVAFTEPIWIHRNPPADLVAWWHDEYPAITDESGVRDAVEAAGFDTIFSFALPADSWWTEYYSPMKGRIREFLAAHPDDALAGEIAAEAEKEIETFERYSDYYSYGFFVVRPS